MLESLLKINATNERSVCLYIFSVHNMKFSFRLVSVAIKIFARHHRHRMSLHGVWQSVMCISNYICGFARTRYITYHLRCNYVREQSKIILFWRKIYFQIVKASKVLLFHSFFFFMFSFCVYYYIFHYDK